MAQRVMARDGRIVVLDEAEIPLGPGDIRVRTAYSVVSPGTERAIVRATEISVAAAHEYPAPDQRWRQLRAPSVSSLGRRPRPPHPDAASLGYSLAGIATEVGTDVLDIQPGDRVACSGSQCAYHAKEVVVPRNLVTSVPAGLGLDAAAHVTLGSIALESFRRTECRLGETVVVIGAGLLGLLVTQLARRAGVYVVVLETDAERRALALGLGALAALAQAGDEAVEQVRQLTGGFGADAVIVAAAGEGSELVNFGFDALRPGGRVVAVGDFGMNLDRQRFFGAQATFVPTIAYGPGRYDPVYEENNVDLPINVVRWTENRNMALFLRLLAEGHLSLTPLPRAEVAFADAAQAYDQLFASRDIITAVLRYDVAGP